MTTPSKPTGSTRSTPSPARPGGSAPLLDRAALADLSHGQRDAVALLVRDLSARRDLTDPERRRIVADRLDGYRERNADRAAIRHPEPERVPVPVPGPARAGRSTGTPPGGPTPPAPRLLASLTCLDCERTIPARSGKPRVPLCGTCAERRATGKARARTARRARDAESPGGGRRR